MTSRFRSTKTHKIMSGFLKNSYVVDQKPLPVVTFHFLSERPKCQPRALVWKEQAPAGAGKSVTYRTSDTFNLSNPERTQSLSFYNGEHGAGKRVAHIFVFS